MKNIIYVLTQEKTGESEERNKKIYIQLQQQKAAPASPEISNHEVKEFHRTKVVESDKRLHMRAMQKQKRERIASETSFGTIATAYFGAHRSNHSHIEQNNKQNTHTQKRLQHFDASRFFVCMYRWFFVCVAYNTT